MGVHGLLFINFYVHKKNNNLTLIKYVEMKKFHKKIKLLFF